MTFRIGQRVRINYGPGTVVEVSDRGYVVVHADVGQAWFRRPEDVVPLDELDERLVPDQEVISSGSSISPSPPL